MKVYYLFDVWPEHDTYDVDQDASEFDTDRDIHSHDEKGYDEWEVEWLLEDICKYHFHNRDGWELADTWNNNGIVIALWDDNKKLVGLYETELEYEPAFLISRVKK